METDFRAEFPVTENLVFLNHANVAPLSRRARDRLQEWANDVTASGDKNIDRWFDEIEEVRRTASRLIHAGSHEEVAFLKNTSEGISLVAEGFPWKAGDNIVILEGEYPSNVYPWMHLRSRGVQLRTIPCEGGRFRIADIAKTADSRTRMVSVSFVHFSTGYRADIGAIGACCRSRGIDLFVDAIQGLGAIPIDVKKMAIDYLSANSHKWLLSPQGAAVFFIDESKIEKIRPVSIGWKSVEHPHNYSSIDFKLRAGADRFECGSFLVPNIVSQVPRPPNHFCDPSLLSVVPH